MQACVCGCEHACQHARQHACVRRDTRSSLLGSMVHAPSLLPVCRRHPGADCGRRRSAVRHGALRRHPMVQSLRCACTHAHAALIGRAAPAAGACRHAWGSGPRSCTPKCPPCFAPGWQAGLQEQPHAAAKDGARQRRSHHAEQLGVRGGSRPRIRGLSVRASRQECRQPGAWDAAPGWPRRLPGSVASMQPPHSCVQRCGHTHCYDRNPPTH